MVCISVLVARQATALGFEFEAEAAKSNRSRKTVKAHLGVEAGAAVEAEAAVEANATVEANETLVEDWFVEGWANQPMLTGDTSKTWVSDDLTSFGSALPVDILQPKPTSTIYIGFDGCEGSKILGSVLSRHPGSIVGKSLEKNYLTSKHKGHCNRFAVKDGTTEYDKYLRSCFKNKIPTANRTTLDFSQSYAMHSGVGVMKELKEMEKEANLRFLAVVCEPRQRAITALQQQITSKKESNSSNVSADEISNGISHGLRKHRAGSYSAIIGNGEYSRVLSAWATKFPLDTTLIINSEKLQEVNTWRRIFAHIGLRVPSDWRVRKWIRMAQKSTDKDTDSDTDDEEVLKERSPDDLEHFTHRRLNDHYKMYDLALWKMLDVKYW